jgi:hypothetical protein
MAWSDEFWKPIRLKDGRNIATLGDARELISTLPPTVQGAEHWQDVEELLARAAIAPSAIDQALTFMLRALKAQWLLWKRP